MYVGKPFIHPSPLGTSPPERAISPPGPPVRSVSDSHHPTATTHFPPLCFVLSSMQCHAISRSAMPRLCQLKN
ncbi:hypothetical protein B0T14DRAFT_501940 [Immersiella caudata]|uniref:Uncharacterized protein n=1 Tax=Immersiella caudata TaxID=314043 RepID=A0AA39XDW0_9PEZI|nr:hypothetical protein B0T14DRAFT_501940 [Immersiella caudata]